MQPNQTTKSAHLLKCVAILLPMAIMGCATANGQAIVYTDNFDAGTSASQWTVISYGGDYTADFAFDYSTRGIPSAPNSTGGSTVGLHLTVNNNDGNAIADGVSAFPMNLTLSGNRTLKFDCWLNYNGGAGGGSGSTEYATFGLFQSGSQVCYPDNASSDGYWFAMTGEGGSSVDYLAYRNAALLSATTGGFAAGSLNQTASFYQTFFTTPPFETTGAPGKQWVEVEVSVKDGVVEWRVNGRVFALRYDTTVTAGKLMLGCMDTFSSIANPAADNFVIFDNVRVEAADCNSNGVADDLDLSNGTSTDCNGNGRLDDCEAITPGDFDNDGDLDGDDFDVFATTIGGPDAPPLVGDADCLTSTLHAFDLVVDSSLDLHDFFGFQQMHTPGPFAPRASDAPTGSQFMAEVATLTREQREDRIMEEILGGNVPGFLRTLWPINVSASISGQTVQATYYVTPDYLCIGRDDDFARIPMTPIIAQPMMDALDGLMPTRKMVDTMYQQAAVKLAPQPISPTTVDITLATTMARHHELVETQRAGQGLGELIGGIKKDVVITPLLPSNPGKVAIYGWHQLNGIRIQPLYLGHVDWYVDYSHGVRLVADKMLVDGVETTVTSVLTDSQLNVLLSDEGVVTNPSY